MQEQRKIQATADVECDHESRMRTPFPMFGRGSHSLADAPDPNPKILPCCQMRSDLTLDGMPIIECFTYVGSLLLQLGVQGHFSKRQSGDVKIIRRVPAVSTTGGHQVSLQAVEASWNNRLKKSYGLVVALEC
jgi:hypothetical protein